MENFIELFTCNDEECIGQVGLLLAMTNSLAGEEELKSLFEKNGYQSVVSEVSGKLKSNFQERFTKSVLGASFAKGIIEPNRKEVHALLHAAEEASKGILGVAASANIRLKVAIVRKEDWIVVATFGKTFIHDYDGHPRSSLGVMHI